MKIKSIIALIAALVLLVVAGATALLMKSAVNSLYHENTAKRFSEDEEYAQFTVFMSQSADFTADKVMYLRYKLEKALTDNSMEASGGARLYADAYSAYGNVLLETEAGRSVNARAVYIGGDYGMFHKELEYAPDITKDLNHDRILISRLAAWKLYGGYELYDFKLSDGKDSFYISGVYTENDGDEYDRFYGDDASCVMDMTKYPDMGITCYELIMVNPVKSFAKNILTEALELEDGTYLLVENSKRFSLGNLYGKLPTLLKSDDKLPDGIVLTPEEMTARQVEKELAVMLALVTALMVYPVIYLLIQAFRLILLIKSFLNKHIFEKIKNKFSYS